MIEALIAVGHPGQVWDYETSRFVDSEWLFTQKWYRITYFVPPRETWPSAQEFIQERRASSMKEVEDYAAVEAKRLEATRFEVVKMVCGWNKDKK